MVSFSFCTISSLKTWSWSNCSWQPLQHLTVCNRYLVNKWMSDPHVLNLSEGLSWAQYYQVSLTTLVTYELDDTHHGDSHVWQSQGDANTASLHTWLTLCEGEAWLGLTGLAATIETPSGRSYSFHLQQIQQVLVSWKQLACKVRGQSSEQDELGAHS